MPEPAEPIVETMRASRHWFRLALALIAVTTVLAFWGMFAHPTAQQDCGSKDAGYFATSLYRLLVLFEPNEANLRLGQCFPDVWQIAAARLTGVAAFFLGAAIGIYELLHTQIASAVIRLCKGHAVVVGFGEIGKVRATELRRDKRRVVAIDLAPDNVLEASARRNGIILVRGDARIPVVQRQAHIRGASDIIVAMGDDTQNLTLGHFFIGMRGRGLISAPRIEISLDSPLVRRAFPANFDAGGIELFSVEETAATLLCRSARFFDIAVLLDQPRIHIVLFGFAPIAERVIAQILRSSPTADLGQPLISLACRDPEAASAQLRLAYPAIPDLAELNLVRCEPTQQTFDRDRAIEDIGRLSPVTAMLVFSMQPRETLPVALALREAMHRRSLWRAPIFFAVDREILYDELACRIETTPRLSDVLHPFEISAQLFARDRAADRDALPRLIHDNYIRLTRAVIAAGTVPSSAGPDDSQRAWERLEHTYRQANRRVADQLPAKLVSAGAYVPRQGLAAHSGFRLTPAHGGAELERLAMLEHRAWMIERRLDGWTYGPVRDDTRRVHDCLIEYSALTEPTKDLDRNQVLQLTGQELLRRPEHIDQSQHPENALNARVRFDLWVGLLGVDTLGLDAATWVDRQLRDAVLPSILSAHPEHNITLLSPLTPGGDLVMVESALGLLGERSHQHRLLVIEGTARALLNDGFHAAWEQHAIGGLNVPAVHADWKARRRQLGYYIERIASGPHCERVIELDAMATTIQPLVRGRQAHNAYLAQRVHVLIVAVDGTHMATPGGMQEPLAWRHDPGSIPADVARHAARPNRAASGTPRTIVLDVAQRKVRHEV